MSAPEGVRYRLEIVGRNHWFVPAFEAVMPKGMPRMDVQRRMADAMATFGGDRYRLTPGSNEQFSLKSIERRPNGFCKSGTCKSGRF